MTSSDGSDVRREFMLRAIELARLGEGHVEPNPMVGAVLVRDGRVVGEGHHARFGGPHAEVAAIASAGSAARGSELFVTLEPCGHAGKTPPCVDAILSAGIASVSAALLDPNPHVSGGGLAALEAAGVATEEGLCLGEATELCRPYLKLMQTGRPWVIAKWAMSADGKIATRTGDSRWISNPASRAIVHTLRGRMDAILVGRGTVSVDDPLLTARPAGPRTPLRVVLDSRGELPLSSQLVQTASDAPVLLATTPDAPGERLRQLRDQGVEVFVSEKGSATSRLQGLLSELGRRQVTNLLVEGGSEVLGSFLDIDEIDEIHLFVAPLLVGGANAVTAIKGAGRESVRGGRPYEHCETIVVEGDLYSRFRTTRSATRLGC